MVGSANRSQVDSCPARQRSHSPHEAWWTSATRRPSASLRDDLVAQDRAGVRRPELLDVRAAEPAGEHPHELAGPVGLRDVRERRLTVLPHDHGAHGRIVGATKGAEWPSSCTAARSSGRRPHDTRAGACRRRSTTWASSTRSSRSRGPFEAGGRTLIEHTGQSALPAIELEDGIVVPRAVGGHGARDPLGALRFTELSGATLPPSRGYSSVGRAPGSHPGGRRFESA